MHTVATKKVGTFSVIDAEGKVVETFSGKGSKATAQRLADEMNGQGEMTLRHGNRGNAARGGRHRGG